mgnify:CR=1 FL=1
MDEQTQVDSPSAKSVEQTRDPIMDAVANMGFDVEQPSDDDLNEPEQDLELETEETESEEDDLEYEDDGEEAELDEEAPEVDLDSIVITVGDEQLSVEDLKSGYLRQADYTKKTQALAEQRREVDQTKEQYASALAYMTQATRQGLAQFDGVDWQTLQQQDPAQYQALSKQYQQAAQQVNAFETAQREFFAQAQQQVEAQQKLQAQQSVETLKTLVPEWSNEMYGELRQFAGNYGMTSEEFNRIADHRPILMMLDAMKFHKSREVARDKKAKPVTSTRKAKASNVNQTMAARQQKSAMDQLRKGRRVEDAAAVLQRDFEKMFAN